MLPRKVGKKVKKLEKFVDARLRKLYDARAVLTRKRRLEEGLSPEDDDELIDLEHSIDALELFLMDVSGETRRHLDSARKQESLLSDSLMQFVRYTGENIAGKVMGRLNERLTSLEKWKVDLEDQFSRFADTLEGVTEETKKLDTKLPALLSYQEDTLRTTIELAMEQCQQGQEDTCSISALSNWWGSDKEEHEVAERVCMFMIRDAADSGDIYRLYDTIDFLRNKLGYEP